MRMNRTRAFALAALASVAACSGGGTDNGTGTANDSEPGQNIAEPDLPNLASNQAAEALPCPNAPGSMCIGPLIVRTESLILLADGSANSDGSRRLAARGNLVFENRTSAPVRLAILDLPIDAAFDNGIRLSVNRFNAVSGVFRCDLEGPECFQGASDRFQTLTSGDSPARATISFNGDMDGSLAASLPSVATATVTLQVYAVGADNSGSVLNISMPNVPVTNQLRR